MTLVLASGAMLLVLGYACAKASSPWREDLLLLGSAGATLALVCSLLAAQLAGPPRWLAGALSLLGAGAFAAGLWVFAALMMAFACDNARPGPELDAAFRVVYAWRYVAPVLVCALGLGVLAGRDGVPLRAWIALAAASALWFGTAMFWLVAGLRASP